MKDVVFKYKEMLADLNSYLTDVNNDEMGELVKSKLDIIIDNIYRQYIDNKVKQG